ncbi:MAG TPA: hypothetical protein VHU83_13685 [Bryobacteraceae bacterium]|jgi:hypothetical protein|nr:hypothetical protein [Bryobacteraceae bacterium]
MIGMASQGKSVQKKIRQSITIPHALAEEAKRVAQQKRLTFSAALVFLAERGAKAEHEAEFALRRNYRRYLKEQDPAKKLQAGDDLIRSIFGADSIA